MSTPILEVKNLQVALASEGAHKPIIHDFSFSLQKGETLALVGESGSGKSICAHSILRLMPSAKIQGEIWFEGQDLAQCTEAKLRQIRSRRIAMIFQEPMSSLNPLHTIGKQISECVALHQRLSPKALHAKTLSLLESVNIPASRHNAFPHELSGGQRQRVMIAIAIANEPAVLIADEPTTSLDVTTQKQILQLLKDLQDKFSMALIFISHNLRLVEQISDKVCVVKDGHQIEYSPTKKLFASPQKAYTKELLQARHLPLVPLGVSSEEILLQGSEVAVSFHTSSFLFKKYYTSVLQGVDFVLQKGGCLGVVGESGSGKSTLAKAIVKLVSSQGELYFEKHKISHYSQKEFFPIRKEIQLVMQDPFGSLSPKMNIEEIIKEGLDIHFKYSTEQTNHAIDEALISVGLAPSYKDRYPHELSGGQRQRVSIARAIILRPKLLVLDEPTSALDASVEYKVIELLQDLQKRFALSYIFISHDIRLIRTLASDVMVLQNGSVVEYGTNEQVFTNPKEEYTRTLLQAEVL